MKDFFNRSSSQSAEIEQKKEAAHNLQYNSDTVTSFVHADVENQNLQSQLAYNQAIYEGYKTFLDEQLKQKEMSPRHFKLGIDCHTKKQDHLMMIEVDFLKIQMASKQSFSDFRDSIAEHNKAITEIQEEIVRLNMERDNPKSTTKKSGIDKAIKEEQEKLLQVYHDHSVTMTTASNIEVTHIDPVAKKQNSTVFKLMDKLTSGTVTSSVLDKPVTKANSRMATMFAWMAKLNPFAKQPESDVSLTLNQIFQQNLPSVELDVPAKVPTYVLPPRKADTPDIDKVPPLPPAPVVTKSKSASSQSSPDPLFSSIEEGDIPPPPPPQQAIHKKTIKRPPSVKPEHQHDELPPPPPPPPPAYPEMDDSSWSNSQSEIAPESLTQTSASSSFSASLSDDIDYTERNSSDVSLEKQKKFRFKSDIDEIETRLTNTSNKMGPKEEAQPKSRFFSLPKSNLRKAKEELDTITEEFIKSLRDVDITKGSTAEQRFKIDRLKDKLSDSLNKVQKFEIKSGSKKYGDTVRTQKALNDKDAKVLTDKLNTIVEKTTPQPDKMPKKGFGKK